jgi:Cdc6-like AAA superfamily ATPase
MAFRIAIGHAGRMKAEELDDLVQHLAVAKYALEAGDPSRAADAVDAAMAIARRVLTGKQSESGPGASESMVRSYPSA